MNDEQLPKKIVECFENIDRIMTDVFYMSKYLEVGAEFLNEYKVVYQAYTQSLERFLAKDIREEDLKTLDMSSQQISSMAHDLLLRCKTKIKYSA